MISRLLTTSKIWRTLPNLSRNLVLSLDSHRSRADKPDVTIEEQKKRIQQMNEYFSQYVDEYYEEEEADQEVEQIEEIREAVDDLVKPHRSEVNVEELLEVLEELKAKDVQVVDVPKDSAPFEKLVLASPYTNRHASALIEQVRLHFVKRYSFGTKNPSRFKQQNGWYILDFHSLVLHVMSEPLRERYDLASLWSGGGLEEQEREMEEKGWLPPQKSLDQPRYQQAPRSYRGN